MPFRNTCACLDTNFLYYFYVAGRLDILWSLFPGGIWIDPAVLEEIRDEFGSDLEQYLWNQGLDYKVERKFTDSDYGNMADIKARHRGLKHADIITIVIAAKHGLTCLSADDPVRKTCEERGIPFSRHLGCLDEAIKRSLITYQEALEMLAVFEEEGLYLPRMLIDDYRCRWKEENSDWP